MRHMIIFILTLYTALIAQEEVDTTFTEEDDFMMEETEEDTSEISDEVVPATGEGLDTGYKGLAWGASVDQLQAPAESDTAGGSVDSASTSKTVHGTLGEDTVSFSYHFSDLGFWKVVIEYTDLEVSDGIDGYIAHFHRIEKALSNKYGSPMRTSQNEMGTDREYLFSSFPKLSRAYFRSSWLVEPASIELLLEAVVPQSADDPPVFGETPRSVRLYYYNNNFFNTAVDDTTGAASEKPLSDIY